MVDPRQAAPTTRTLDPGTLLALVPQRTPFRFVDEIVEVDESHIVGRYTFRDDEFFYTGHFPAKPITPGVILVETMAQIGLVALGLYLAAVSPAIDEQNLLVWFTEADVEFTGIVGPGDQVTVSAEKIYFRKLKLKVAAEMTLADGTVVCAGELAGVGSIS
ncbi:MAG: beta-hydroxyacyl-ACP dehydratase [Thermoanaerobaculia bacterium]